MFSWSISLCENIREAEDGRTGTYLFVLYGNLDLVKCHIFRVVTSHATGGKMEVRFLPVSPEERRTRS